MNSHQTRLLPVDGAYNLRDMGGYKTVDGKYVKWRTVFRSGDLNTLSSRDLDYLTGLNIKSFIDFRDNDEKSAAPDKTPKSLLHAYDLPINGASLINLQSLSTADAPGLMVQAYRTFVRDMAHVYRLFFKILMNGESAPLLFHCSAGKDRTGYAALLFLLSLNVPRETVLEDYLLSDRYLQGKYAGLMSAHPALVPLMTVNEHYFQAALDIIDGEYGGPEKYLTECLDVDINKMKALYTE